MTISPPTFPLRPVNGGPLPKAQPKFGKWRYEPKVNGWRAWVHRPTGAMFNRENKPLSITHEFKTVLEKLRGMPASYPEWLDCEAMSRRVPVGKGSLIMLDYVPVDHYVDCNYDQRISLMVGLFFDNGPGLYWQHEEQPPPDNELLCFGHTYEDEATQRDDRVAVIDEQLFPMAAWQRLQACNKRLGCELFEGLVAKRADSKYPLQLRSHDQDFPFWQKHRWDF